MPRYNGDNDPHSGTDGRVGETAICVIDWRELLLLKLMRIFSLLPIRGIPRFSISSHGFSDYFKGFDKVKTVRELFGEKTEDVLHNLRVEFSVLAGYMGVSGKDGHLIVNTRYLNGGDRIDVYLDVVHELVHVRQFVEGKELFDTNYGYAERPTEVEAYMYAVKEARNLGLSDERICEYLKTEWMSEDDLRRLARALGVKC
jgi:hypothetical protein